MKPHDLLQQLQLIPKDYFSVQDIRKLYAGDDATLAVTLTRLTNKGFLTRLFRGYYALHPERVDFESLACVIKKPSYISFESALYHHGCIDQIPESITLATSGKSQTLSMKNKTLEYSHLSPDLYFGYEILDGCEMASPEKALLDQLYFASLGKTYFDEEELSLKGLKKRRFLQWSRVYPASVQRRAKALAERFGKMAITLKSMA